MDEFEIDLRPDERFLLNGFFAVDHKKVQRAIVDCRPANTGETRLRFSTLPNGPMLYHLRLSKAEGLRGSGDDLANWFYQLKEAPSVLPRRAFGRCNTDPDAVDLGFDAARRYRMVLSVTAMGTSNAPDIAQVVHEEVLTRGGCLLPGTTLHYGTPLPPGDILEGIYLDDHLVVQRGLMKNLRSPFGPDAELIRRSHAAYERFTVDRSVGKTFGFSRASATPAEDVKFLTWGSEVDGARATVRAPIGKCVP